MAGGVLVFAGMQVGVLPDDLKITLDPAGASSLVLSTAYNVLPLWLRNAEEALRQAKDASRRVQADWGANEERNKELLIAELGPSLQVFVSCGIALDAFYDLLKPFAKISPADIAAWTANNTARHKQIVEIIRRVYRLDAPTTAAFTRNVSEVIKFRDVAVHPSLELKQACTRPDIPVGVDWKFSAYRHGNALECFNVTMRILLHLFKKKSASADVDQAMKHVVDSLLELKVISKNQP